MTKLRNIRKTRPSQSNSFTYWSICLPQAN